MGAVYVAADDPDRPRSKREHRLARVVEARKELPEGMRVRWDRHAKRRKGRRARSRS